MKGKGRGKWKGQQMEAGKENKDGEPEGEGNGKEKRRGMERKETETCFVGNSIHYILVLAAASIFKQPDVRARILRLRKTSQMDAFVSPSGE